MAKAKDKAAVPEESEIGREVREQIESTENLLAAHKYEHAQALRRAQQGGELPSANQLQTIGKLELLLINLKSHLRCHELTRERE